MLPSSGPLSLLQIAEEFGGDFPHNLSEYYAGGLYVPPGTQNGSGINIPSSGALSLFDFYGTERRVTALTHVATVAVSANTITVPLSAQAGDIAIYVDHAARDEDNGWTVTQASSDWQRIISATGSDDDGSPDGRIYLNTYIKVLQATDIGKAIAGNSAYYKDKVMLIFRPNTPITDVDVLFALGMVGGNKAPYSSNLPATTIPIASEGRSAIVIGAAGSSNTAITQYSLPSLNIVIRGRVAVGWKIYQINEARSNIIIDKDNDKQGTHSLQGIHIALS